MELPDHFGKNPEKIESAIDNLGNCGESSELRDEKNPIIQECGKINQEESDKMSIDDQTTKKDLGDQTEPKKSPKKVSRKM